MRRTALLGTLLAAFLAAGCGEEPAARDAGRARVARVRVRKVVRAPSVRSIRVNGSLESVSDVLISAEVAGRVVERPRPEGARVVAGEPVLRLEETTHRLQRDLARVAAEEAALHPDVAARERATSALQLEIAQDRLDRCRILAPVDGTIEEIMVDEGEWVAPGSAVARLVDLEQLRIFVEVAENEVVHVRPGTGIRFRVDAWGPEEFPATVHRTAKAADPQTGKFRVELRVKPSSRPGKPLLVGMFATARIPVDDGGAIVALEKRALTRRFEETFCFVAEKSGDGFLASERRVRVAPLPGDLERVRVEAGLKEGETVILGPLLGLRDGMAVHLVEGGEAE